MVDIRTLDYVEIHRKLADHFKEPPKTVKVAGPFNKHLAIPEGVFLDRRTILLFVNDVVPGPGLSSQEVSDVFDILLDLGVIKPNKHNDTFFFNKDF